MVAVPTYVFPPVVRTTGVVVLHMVVCHWLQMEGRVKVGLYKDQNWLGLCVK